MMASQSSAAATAEENQIIFVPELVWVQKYLFNGKRFFSAFS